ncbi:hypothetical protein I1A62_32530 [Rhodococcus sp. USK10]|uniref:hypothetical protein n=1 Tax=Rhodococcus sp. USK10 TaxID=2789739 RepID=UPI001C5D9D34|nr:hypothetical protein [Rhodococcus sp. USK10]QYB01930.1 hypothetical protein I1A62_32530 [Rhodococcus sp. USK10]
MPSSSLRDAGYSGPLSIENEDYTLGQCESVALAVDTLQRARSAATARTPTATRCPTVNCSRCYRREPASLAT